MKLQRYRTDVSESLLADAREKNKAIDNAVDFSILTSTEVRPALRYFDLNLPALLFTTRKTFLHPGEMHRVLKPGRTPFTTGPMPRNKQVFYDIIREATGNHPPMPAARASVWHLLHYAEAFQRH
jgi:hypothetical protein